MKITKLYVFFILIITISMAQGCIPYVDSTNYVPITKESLTKIPSTRKIFTKTPKSTPTKSFYGSATVIVNLCNLRKGPGTNYPIVDYSEKGKVHKIYGVNAEGTWLLLDKQKSVWIALSLVSLDTDISSIPIIQNLSSLDIYENPKPTNQNMGIVPTQKVGIPEPTQFIGCPSGCTYHPTGCDIKGNISYSTGEKIYHVPGGEFYDECTINPNYGE